MVFRLMLSGKVRFGNLLMHDRFSLVNKYETIFCDLLPSKLVFRKLLLSCATGFDPELFLFSNDPEIRCALRKLLHII